MDCKGKAYSRGENNANSNFYRVGEATGHGPVAAAWTYALKHIDAISAYVKGGCEGTTIGGESVESRLGDAVNYLFIMYSLLVQEGILSDPTGPTPDGMSDTDPLVEDPEYGLLRKSVLDEVRFRDFAAKYGVADCDACRSLFGIGKRTVNEVGHLTLDED